MLDLRLCFRLFSALLMEQDEEIKFHLHRTKDMWTEFISRYELRPRGTVVLGTVTLVATTFGGWQDAQHLSAFGLMCGGLKITFGWMVLSQGQKTLSHAV